jgi:hypothetical protein
MQVTRRTEEEKKKKKQLSSPPASKSEQTRREVWRDHTKGDIGHHDRTSPPRTHDAFCGNCTVLAAVHSSLRQAVSDSDEARVDRFCEASHLKKCNDTEMRGGTSTGNCSSVILKLPLYSQRIKI